MIDYRTLFYDRIYAALGVPATFTPLDTGVPIPDLTVVPKLKGIDVSGSRIGVQGSFGAEVAVKSMLPAARLRMYELTAKGVDRDKLDGGTIEFSSKTWRVDNHQLSPSPDGDELGGEVFVFLSDPAI